MELFFRKLGSGEPLIILHGLYGSSDNWYTIGRALADHHEVFMIDQRNHGLSPHSPDHNYRVMCNDLADFFIRIGINRAIFLGHSMGGKTALAFGMEHPEKVKKMILVDISPFAYDLTATEEANSHQHILQGLLAIHTETIASRGEADIILQRFVNSLSVRQFLLKNLKRDSAGKFHWTLNLPVLAENLEGIFAGIIPENDSQSNTIPQFPLLFIKGEYSGYINKKDEALIRHLLPWSQITTIRGAGHWIHAEQPAAFLEAVRDFIGR